MSDLAVKGRRVLTPEGMRPASVLVRDGVVVEVAGFDVSFAGARTVDAGEAVVMPGVVDTHVHVNEPGRTEWEGFETATRAAASGGVTTIGDMPLNSLPVTTTPEALETKRRSASGKTWVDTFFWGGVVPANAASLAPLLAAGVPGAKCFLVHSGIDEFPNVTEADLERAMPALARAGAVLLVHAELPGPIDAASRLGGDPRRHSTWLHSRPRASENEAVALVTRLAERIGCRVHVVHLSSSDALHGIAEAKRRGVPLTVETCPHYLTFTAEEIGEGRTEFKCAPPIRERENREKLWEGLRDGTIDMVVSDHSPCVPALKALDSGDYAAAWGGISSLQLVLPAAWTGARAHGFGVESIVEWMCRRPASLASLAGRKGTLSPGADADLVVWHPEREFVVDAASLRHRHPVTPYAGRTLFGVVERTFVRGEPAFENGEPARVPTGRLL